MPIQIETIGKNKIVITPVNEFASIMGYCEYRLSFSLAGYEAPKTREMNEGSKKHLKQAEKEKELFEFKPITFEELMDIEAEVEFPYESVYTRLLRKKGKWFFLFCGKADKVFTKNKILYIEETKFTSNPHKYDNLNEAFLDQVLQTLLYCNSQFDSDGCFDPTHWFSMPQKTKIYIIRIKDMSKPINKKTGEYPDYKIFEVKIDKNLNKMLEEKIKKFQDLIIGKEFPQHHNNMNKCLACRFSSKCSNKLI